MRQIVETENLDEVRESRREFDGWTHAIGAKNYIEVVVKAKSMPVKLLEDGVRQLYRATFFPKNSQGEVLHDSPRTFDARKTKLTCSAKYGFTLYLEIHPDDKEAYKLWSDGMETQYYVILFPLSADAGLAADAEVIEGRRMVQSAIMLCKDKRFQSWMVHEGMTSSPTEAGAAEGLRLYLNVQSRSELATDVEAQDRFTSVRRRYKLALEELELRRHRQRE